MGRIAARSTVWRCGLALSLSLGACPREPDTTGSAGDGSSDDGTADAPIDPPESAALGACRADCAAASACGDTSDPEACVDRCLDDLARLESSCAAATVAFLACEASDEGCDGGLACPDLAEATEAACEPSAGERADCRNACTTTMACGGADLLGYASVDECEERCLSELSSQSTGCRAADQALMRCLSTLDCSDWRGYFENGDAACEAEVEALERTGCEQGS